VDPDRPRLRTIRLDMQTLFNDLGIQRKPATA
jgi:hypothetical protein